MRHTLWFRLTAAFLLVAIVGVATVALLANRITTSRFQSYLQTSQWGDVRADLAALYARQGNWEGAGLLLAGAQPGQGGSGLVLLDENGSVVAAAGGRGNRPTGPADADLSLPVVVNGRTAATLLVRSAGAGAGARAATQFLAEVNQAVWWGGALSVLLAVGLGLWLARRLTRPVTQLTAATHRLAQGDLQQTVATTAPGELGELAASFNQMAGALAQAEQQRQQLLADVAHELRTPLSIMRGHVEAMLDGVFALTPENLAVVHEETILLGRLVEDLRTLSLAESGQLPLNRQTMDLAQSVQQAAAAFEPLAEANGVRLHADISPTPPILADADRLQQVMGNLVANALRHVGQSSIPDHSPAVCLRLRVMGDTAVVQVIDNGPGIPADAQPHVFDRFWRAESSRARDRGGSGLGLAICRAIVLAHHGRIWVEDTPGGGATFAFALPLTAAS